MAMRPLSPRDTMPTRRHGGNDASAPALPGRQRAWFRFASRSGGIGIFSLTRHGFLWRLVALYLKGMMIRIDTVNP